MRQRDRIIIFENKGEWEIYRHKEEGVRGERRMFNVS
jgi:hypothetical protein